MSSLAAPHPPLFCSVSVSLASDGPASALLYVVVGSPVTSWRGGVVALLLREPPEGQPRPISPCPAAHQLASPPVDLHLLSLSSMFPSTHGRGGESVGDGGDSPTVSSGLSKGNPPSRRDSCSRASGRRGPSHGRPISSQLQITPTRSNKP